MKPACNPQGAAPSAAPPVVVQPPEVIPGWEWHYVDPDSPAGPSLKRRLQLAMLAGLKTAKQVRSPDEIPAAVEAYAASLDLAAVSPSDRDRVLAQLAGAFRRALESGIRNMEWEDDGERG